MDLLIVVMAAVLAWVVGAVWNMIVSRPRARMSGVRVDNTGRPDGKSALPYLIAGLGLVVVAGMMRHVFAMSGIDTLGAGLVSGFGIGAFLVMPWMLINNVHLQRPLRLTLIDGGYAVLACAAMGAVLGAI